VVRLTASDSLLTTSDDCTVVVSTSDTAVPVISGLAASSFTSSSAVVKWTTSVPADQQVDYGTTAAYGSSTALDTTKATSHTVTLGALLSGSTYHYRARSRDAAGNLAVSGDFTFTTAGATSLLPPTNVTTAVSPTPGSGWNACDISQNTSVDVIDVQLSINMSLSIIPCVAAVNGVGICNAVTVQRVVNSALGASCVTDPMTGPTTATVAWAASSSTGVVGYNVYRSTSSGGPYVKANPALVGGTKFMDITVQAGQTYYYVVSAVDGAGIQSGTSVKAVATVP
jgi:hypothetical protein